MMKSLQALIGNETYTILQGNADTPVSSLAFDSRKVQEGGLFVCMPGAKVDGAEYAPQAVAKGASVIVAERDVRSLLSEAVGTEYEGGAYTLTKEQAENVTVLQTEDSRNALAHLSAAWFDHPADKMQIIGITGTKGKTTSTYLVKSILEQAGHKVGLVGTIEIIIGEEHIPADHTTPESLVLQSYFDRMVKAGCDTVVMEVSSQALKLKRTEGFVFDYGIFTNLSPDHIGPAEHADFEEYLYCKSLLFRQCKVGIANCDDAYWQQVTKDHTCTLETYGFSEGADYRAGKMVLFEDKGLLGVTFETRGKVEDTFSLSMPGRFSVYNALCAIAICDHFGVDAARMKEAVAAAHVKGRIERVHVSDEYTLLIDYAHNAMSLESLLLTLREYHPKRLVCLFGCGGNRSNLRRFEMGEVSGTLADLTIITSDNPRDEEPQAIIDDIKTGIGKTEGKYIEIIDRREAIRYAIDHAKSGDLIVLAGKGHEDYQEIKGKKYPMDERVIIEEIKKEKGLC